MQRRYVLSCMILGKEVGGHMVIAICDGDKCAMSVGDETQVTAYLVLLGNICDSGVLDLEGRKRHCDVLALQGECECERLFCHVIMN